VDARLELLGAHRDDLDRMLAGAEDRAVALDRDFVLRVADRDDLLAHRVNLDPGASSATPSRHSGHAASSNVSKSRTSSASYGASNRFVFPLRLRIDAKPTTSPPCRAITSAVSRVDLPVVTTSSTIT